jgi:hypothetical protein
VPWPLARPLQGVAGEEEPMTTALEIGGAFLLAPTLLAAAMFLAAFHLGRLITRDDEQREVEVTGAPEVAVHDLMMGRVCSRRARIWHVDSSTTAGSPSRACSGWKGTLTTEQRDRVAASKAIIRADGEERPAA